MAICDYCRQEMTADATVDCPGNTDGLPFVPGRRLSREEWMDMWRRSQAELPPGFPVLDSDEAAIERCGQYLLRWDRCHDCGILAGGRHHPGCDAEVCPHCEGQRIGCDCGRSLDDDEEDTTDGR